MAVFALIGAAGMGQRMQVGKNKALLEIRGQTVVQRSVHALSQSTLVDALIIIGRLEEVPFLTSHLANFPKIRSIIAGGPERQDSMYLGLKEATRLGAQSGDLIIFHDAARCLIEVVDIDACIQAGLVFGAAVAGAPAKDTIKRVQVDGLVMETIPRSEVYTIQTPQVIEFSLAQKAFEKAFSDQFYGTDDVSLVERLSKPVKVVTCSRENIKLTTPEDLLLAEAILIKRDVK